MEKELIVILGMHRSGTSVLTKGIIELGYFSGETLEGNKSNEKGYFENVKLRLLNDEILDSLNSSWKDYDNTYLNRPELFLPMLKELYFDRAVDLIQELFKYENKCVIKDPRMSVLLPFWKLVIEHTEIKCNYILAIRNPNEVTSSLVARKDVTSEVGLKLWLYYNTMIMKNVDDEITIVDYNKFMANPKKIIVNISEQIGVNINEIQQKIDEYCDSFVEKRLKHQESKTTDFPVVIQKVFNFLEGQDTLKGSKNFLEETEEEINSYFKELDLSENKEYIQIYADLGKGFNESDSEKFYLKPGYKQKIKIDLSKYEQINNIRLDPTNNESIVVIDSLVFSAKDEETGVLIKTTNADYEYNNTYVFPEDSQIYFEKISNKIDGLTLNMNVLPKDKSTKIILNDLKKEQELNLEKEVNKTLMSDLNLINKKLNDIELLTKENMISSTESILVLQNEIQVNREIAKVVDEKLFNDIDLIQYDVSNNNAMLQSMQYETYKNASTIEKTNNYVIELLRIKYVIIYILKLPFLLVKTIVNAVIHPKRTFKYATNKFYLSYKSYFDKDLYIYLSKDPKINRFNAKRHYIQYGAYECRQVNYDMQVSENVREKILNNYVYEMLKKGIKSLFNQGITETFNKVKKVKSGELYKATKTEYNIDEEFVLKEGINDTTNILVVINIENNYNLLEKTISSIIEQNYSKVEIRLLSQNNVENSEFKVINNISRDTIGSEFDYLTIINSGDTLNNTTLKIVNQVTQEKNYKIIFGDENIVSEDYSVIKTYFKSKLIDEINFEIIGYGCFVNCENVENDDFILSDYINKNLVNLKDIKHINKIFYNRYFLSPVEESKEKIKPIAFYLPQYHSFPENDKWWGEGFTEWTNTVKGRPMFDGHYQPHEPADEIGYYNLVNDPDIQRKQIELAKQYGIHGFCYYYYWFEGKKLMEKPLENMLADKSLDLPFCICWANETWSRRWTGEDKEILIKQEHNQKTDVEFIYDVLDIFRDERYIKLNGKPMLLVYRAELFPNLNETIITWNEICEKEGLGGIEVVLVQSFGLTDPAKYGANYAVEFPPHGLNIGQYNHKVENLDDNYSGNIYNYPDAVSFAAKIEKQHYNLFRSCMLGWDNTARRNTASNIFANFSVSEFKKWLVAIFDYTYRFNDFGEQFVFINAWNEWAEGTHLEPDLENGFKYLETVKSVVDLYDNKNDDQDTVSVVIPTYNCEDFIIETLNSVKNQTYQKIELVIIDDFSKDDTVNVIKKYLEDSDVEKRFTNIVVNFRDVNLGAHATINEGIKKSSGKWIAILNSDDLYEYNRISAVMHCLTNSTSKIAFTKCMAIDEKGNLNLTNEGKYFNELQDIIVDCDDVHIPLIESNVAISTGNFIFARELFDEIGGFEDYKYCHDWDFILKSTIKTEPIFIQNTSYLYRLHTDNSFRELDNKLAIKETKEIMTNHIKDVKNTKSPDKKVLIRINEIHGIK